MVDLIITFLSLYELCAGHSAQTLVTIALTKLMGEHVSLECIAALTLEC
jgi:hypothetical protein